MKIQESRTRRQLLQATLGTGFAVAGTVIALEAKGQDKIAPATVQYQKEPKDGNKCSMCVNWVAPNACNIVSGTIDPNGWCIAYAPKES